MGATDKLYSRKMEIYYQKNYENATNLITHDHHLIQDSMRSEIPELENRIKKQITDYDAIKPS